MSDGQWQSRAKGGRKIIAGSLSRLRPVHGLVVAAFVLAVGGVALAGSGGGVINACVNSKTRVLTVPKAGKGCGRGESSLSWNVKGQRGGQGSQGIQGKPGNAGGSLTSADSRTGTKPLGSTDITLLSAQILTTSFSRIEASGGGTFSYAPSGAGAAELDCGLQLSSGGGSTTLGNRTQEDFSGSVAYKEPGSAGGAVTAQPGLYTVSLLCKQTASNSALSFEHGDLNVISAAP
jgi:hypothetical protein